MKARITGMFKDSLRIGVIVAALSVVASLLMFHVYTQYRIVELGYEIANVTSEHRRLLEQNKKLAIEAAVVGRTERISSVAKDRFGLEPVRPEQVRTIGIDAVSANAVSPQEVAVQ